MFIIEEIPKYLKPKYDILALGTDTRQKIAFSKGGRVFELRPRRDFACPQDFYCQAARFLFKKIKTEFHLISFDPHLLFASRAFSEIIKNTYYPYAKLAPVWHHVAHIASFGSGKREKQNFIGVAFDGTGYGADGRVWGGEFFIYKNRKFLRRAHFKYQPLCGNELAIEEPWRFAFGVLYSIYGFKNFPFDLACFKNIKKNTFKMFAQMIDKRFNTPLVSSVGRLFDAVGALLNLKAVMRKEAQWAIAVEEAAAKYNGKSGNSYGFKIKKQEGCFCIETDSMFKKIVCDLRKGAEVEKIAYCFHLTLAEAVRHACLLLSREYEIKNVYCSGGVFMNDILCTALKQLFKKEDLKLYFAPRPFNTDSGIARGQIAACMMEKLCA